MAAAGATPAATDTPLFRSFTFAATPCRCHFAIIIFAIDIIDAADATLFTPLLFAAFH